MKRNFFKFDNTDFLPNFSSKGRHVTHEVGVACRTLCNCVVRIGNLYDCKECSNNLLHNKWTIKVRMWWKTHVKLTQHCWQSYEKKKCLKIQNIDFLNYFSSKGRHVTHDVGEACGALCNCSVRISNLYDWKEHSNNLLHNKWENQYFQILKIFFS